MATQADVAAHLDMSQQAVSKLVRDGVIPRAEKGQYDLDECRRKYLRHLEREALFRLMGAK